MKEGNQVKIKLIGENKIIKIKKVMKKIWKRYVKILDKKQKNIVIKKIFKLELYLENLIKRIVMIIFLMMSLKK